MPRSLPGSSIGSQPGPRAGSAPGSGPGSSLTGTAWGVALGLLLGATPGCLGHRTGRPERIGTRNVETFSRSDTAAPAEWQRVLVGAPRPRVRGYVKSTSIDLERREQGRLHWIYDQAFVLVGRVSPRGETVRIDAKGDERYQGSFKLEHAVLVLLGGGREDEVQLSPMPDPRG